jgi:hypothetical protein
MVTCAHARFSTLRHLVFIFLTRSKNRPRDRMYDSRLQKHAVCPLSFKGGSEWPPPGEELDGLEVGGDHVGLLLESTLAASTFLPGSLVAVKTSKGWLNAICVCAEYPVSHAWSATAYVMCCCCRSWLSVLGGRRTSCGCRTLTLLYLRILMLKSQGSRRSLSRSSTLHVWPNFQYLPD